MPDGVLKLRVVDVYGDPLQEAFDVFLRHQVLSHDVALRNMKAKELVIRDLYQSPQGLYRIEVDAPSYLAVSQFFQVPSSGAGSLTITLPVNKSRIVSVQFPDFGAIDQNAQAILGRSTSVSSFPGKSGAELYSAFDDVRKAGFLNLVAKASHTKLTNGQTVITYIDQITEQRGDRFFALVSPDLHGEVLHSVGDEGFHKVPDDLHVPPAGFEKVDSFKTQDHYGNLQLTFSKKGTAWCVDTDIDDAQGFEHIFQVIRNVSGPTHPYNIHEILVAFQELDPGYRFNLAVSATKHA